MFEWSKVCMSDSFVGRLFKPLYLPKNTLYVHCFTDWEWEGVLLQTADQENVSWSQQIL